MKKFSLVIPCYNEEKNLELVVDKVKQALSRCSLLTEQDFELVLVENGSSDGSVAKMQELQKENSFIKIEPVLVNQGYGFGVKSGVKAAEGNFIGVCHADMQTDPYDAFKGYEIVSRADKETLVKGNRIGRPWQAACFSRIFEIIASIITQKLFHEINAQPKVFAADFKSEVAKAPHDYCFDVFLLLRAKNRKMRIVSIPVLFPDRLHGESTWAFSFRSKLKTIYGFVSYLIRYRFS